MDRRSNGDVGTWVTLRNGRPGMVLRGAARRPESGRVSTLRATAVVSLAIVPAVVLVEPPPERLLRRGRRLGTIQVPAWRREPSRKLTPHVSLIDLMQ